MVIPLVNHLEPQFCFGATFQFPVRIARAFDLEPVSSGSKLSCLQVFGAGFSCEFDSGLNRDFPCGALPSG